jgi:general secretion pathway protein C
MGVVPASLAEGSPALWRERWRALSPYAPVAVSALLAVLIAAELARIVLAFSARSPPDAVPVSGARHSPLDARRIVAAHLFGAPPPVQDPADAPLTAADLKLSGTIATAEPKHGFAIIVGGGGASRFYAVGDSVGGAALYSVYIDHVILDRGGALETLFLPHTTLAAVKSLARVANARPAHGPFLDNMGRVVDHDPGVLDGMVRALDVRDEKSDRVRGFRVYPVASGVAMGILGLEPGDIVTSVNGVPLDDLQKGRQLLEAIRPESSATVTVERQGGTLTLTLNVADAAAALKNEAAAKGAAAASPDRT